MNFIKSGSSPVLLKVKTYSITAKIIIVFYI